MISQGDKPGQDRIQDPLQSIGWHIKLEDAFGRGDGDLVGELAVIAHGPTRQAGIEPSADSSEGHRIPAGRLEDTDQVHYKDGQGHVPRSQPAGDP